jgi:DNA repair exonuclease SbcCD ATPase subunit
MVFTPGNLLTMGICLLVVLLFRQLDKNNRSMEKVKKFGDKLKADLDLYIKERSSRLDESSVSLDVQQAKAVAAVKRLESIREELSRREEELLARTKAIGEIERQIQGYDETIKKLMEMTGLAEENLARITSESGFADLIGKKLGNAQRQLDEITSSVPALRAEFADENRRQLAQVQGETISALAAGIADLERRVEAAQAAGSRVVDTAAERLQELLRKAMSEATRRADALEDAAFTKLKDQAVERLGRYRETIEEKTGALHEHAKEKLSEMQALARGFKSEWEAEAKALIAASREEMRAAAQETAGMRQRVDELAVELSAKLSALSEKAATGFDAVSRSIEESLGAHRKDVDYRVGQFERFMADVERMDGGLRAAMAETEARVNADFARYAEGEEAKRAAFSKKLDSGADALAARLGALEGELNELKSKAYANVSDKLQVFEDEFFADLARRGEAITAELAAWRDKVDSSLESLSLEGERSRKEAEARYAAELSARLQKISDGFRADTDKLESQVQSIEADLRSRITASDQSILAFVEQFRSEFAEARQKMDQQVQNEIGAHSVAVQETLKRQERELESRAMALAQYVEQARTEASAVVESLSGDLASWRAKTEQQLSGAREEFAEKLASFEQASGAAISASEAAYQAKHREFMQRADGERKLMKEAIDALHRDSKAAVAEFKRAYEEMAADVERRVRETGSETDKTLQALRAGVQDLRAALDETQDRLTRRVRDDSAALSQNLDEIDKRVKAFVAQTKVFERADELKAALEASLGDFRAEIGRLDVYRDTMANLEQQYARIKKLEEETGQKVTRFLTEKKRVDIIEADFNKLLALSESIDRKMEELTVTGDDLQQYQVQIRRFEEGLAEANGRYERLEKKAVVLDQTVTGIDRAFDALREAESAIAEHRAALSSMPSEVESLKKSLDELLGSRDQVNLTVERISALDGILSDVEKRTEKMQTAREWLARTETRLEEISRKSEEQLKLLADVLKEDGASRKTKGAPPIGIRENVVKLAHQGWKVDEIARALHLSRGEVELILELPQK